MVKDNNNNKEMVKLTKRINQIVDKHTKNINISKSQKSSFFNFLLKNNLTPKNIQFYDTGKETIITYLKHYKLGDSSKKKILDTIKKIIKNKVRNKKKQEELFNFYQNEYKLYSKNINEKRGENLIPDRYKEAYEKGYEFYKSKIPGFKYVQDELLYMLLFGTRFTGRKGDYPHLYYKSNDENVNTYDGETFIWRKYKTKKIYGVITYKVEEELKKYLDDYIEKNNIQEGDLMLKSIKKGEVIIEFGDYIKRSVKTYSGISNMTMDTIRKIKIKQFFLDNKDIRSKSMNDQNEYTKQHFMNSVNTIMIDYRKIIQGDMTNKEEKLEEVVEVMDI
jgi:hypothetical protein